MNILVTGANGQLGREIRTRSAASPNNFVFTDVGATPELDTVFLDITNKDAVSIIVESEKIDVIVNCAAYTNVDKAESDVDFARMLNTDAVANLAQVAKKSGTTLIHISTDYVFSGDGNVPISEREQPDPRSVYGSTKLSGELAVASSGCKSIILRTSWLYSPYGRNFVKTMRELTSSKPSVKVVYDQVGSPTYAGDLADAILHIIDTGRLSLTGIYHFSGEGAVSWYDFAREICEQSGNICDIQPCLSSEFESKVARPHYSVLDKSLFKEKFSFRIPYWKDSLKKCIEALKKSALCILLLFAVSMPSRAQYSDLNYFETYLQYAPAVLDAGLGLLGVDSKNDFLDRGISIGISFATNLVVVKSLKYLVGETRPDGSSDNSFPSGHTATAFLGAELIREHYGWAWGAGAYAAATTVGVMRVVRQRHYWWDVLAGAGLGVLSARVGIKLAGPVRDWIDPERRMKFASYIEPQTGAVCAALTYTF